MAERAFYDTVIFKLSLNRQDPDHEACRALLDVESGGVVWGIVISAITRGEAPIWEYLDQLEQRCALQGVEWIEVRQEEITEEMRRRARSLKSALEQAGMQSRDIKQAFAAAWAKASVFVTRDHDFFDPKDKSRRGKKARGTKVSGVLREHLDVEALFPADALRKLRRLTDSSS